MPNSKKRPKFRVGQVVCILPCDHSQFGRISEKLRDGKIRVQFWDADQADVWTWDYEPKNLRPLTARERGSHA